MARVLIRVLVNGHTRVSALVHRERLPQTIQDIKDTWERFAPRDRLAIVTDAGNVTSLHWSQGAQGALK
jgi:hypothetical protein